MRHLKEYFLICSLLSMCFWLAAQTQDWAWAQVAGGTTADYAEGITTDNLGNSYIAGVFTGTASFGSITVTSAGLEDIFVAKIDSLGNWIWAIRAGGQGNDLCGSIAVDSNLNLYITGCFTQTADFGSTILEYNNERSIFVAKITGDGTWIWAHQVGDGYAAMGTQITTDTSSNIYLTGYFQDSVQFGNTSLYSNGAKDIFVAKMDSNGNWIWLRGAGGAGDDISYDLAVDTNGNPYVTGQFVSTAYFGESVISSLGGADIFVAKLDSNGNWLWAQTAGGFGDVDRATGIAVDGSANIYLTGRVEGNVRFGMTTLPGFGGYDLFVAKMSSNGNWLWAVNAGGITDDCGYGIAVGTDNTAYLTGRFTSIALFGNTSLACSGIFDIFVSALDTNGNWLWTKQGGGTDNDYSYGISLDCNNTISISGYVSGTAFFGNHSVTSSGASDILVTRLSYKTATPSFNPSNGVYTHPIYVTISCITENAEIHYTLDGSVPTLTSPIYTIPLYIDSNTTIHAIALSPGFIQSDQASESYQISEPAPTPVFNPISGTYASSVSVSMICSHSGAIIRYTLDGTEPTSSSSPYSSPIYVESTTTIMAKAYESGLVPSATGSATYTITGTVATPVVSPPSGVYSTSQNVVLSCPTSGAEFRYTLDGTEPTSTSTLYTSPIYIEASATIKARGFLSGWTPSTVTTSIYTITGTVATPVFSIPSGIYSSAVNISLICDIPGAYMRFTLDGTDPTSSSSLYTLPIYLESFTTTVKARAYLPGWTPSAIASATYRITGTVATPVFNPPPGLLESNQAITLSCNTPDAQIRYTLDGTNPTYSSPLYASPIYLDSATTIKAKAYLADWEPSAISSAGYQTPVSNFDELNSADQGILDIYPNPFRTSTTIALNVKEPNQSFQIKVYNLKGECVYAKDGVTNGKLNVTWNGTDKNNNPVASGLYILKFTSGKQNILRKIVLL
ncbi:MAG: hypothetical protein CVU50_08985 [Candidatus Cloacimonetes bacterium HGW-Cloacimonetes-3]|nr:MAG: hypothetical protein CVU50_08985 [Candidatus Cloacimonetes bacterium HGW-Cloacimonetes-3]